MRGNWTARHSGVATSSRPARAAMCLAAVLVAMLTACTPKDPAIVRAEAISHGDALVTEGKPFDAARAYRTALAINALDGPTRMKLSKALRAAEEWGPAANEGIRAASLLPDDFDAQLWGVAMMLSLSQFVDAEGRIAQLLETHPDHPALLVLRGNVTARLIDSTWGLFSLNEALRTRSRYEYARQILRQSVQPQQDRAAEEDFRRALELDPTFQDAQFALISFLWATGRPDAAEPLLRKLADQLPGHALVNGALGRYYLQRQRWADAERYLKQAQDGGAEGIVYDLADLLLQTNRLDEVLTLLQNDRSADAVLRIAAAERQRGRPAEAARALDALLEREPRQAAGWEGKAELLMEMHDGPAAVLAARRAVSLSPSSESAHLVLARALSSTGQTGEALDHFIEVTRLNPGVKGVAREQARLALSLGRNKAAHEFARLAVRDAPTDRDAQADLVRALLRTGDTATAERTLAPLLGGAAPSPELLILSADVHAARGRVARARTDYLRAWRLDRTRFEAIARLVALEIGAGQIGQARLHADEAIRVNPDSAPALLLSATVQLAAAAPAEAEALAKRALGLAPDNDEATLVLADAVARQGRKEDATRILEQQMARRPTLDAQLALAALLDELGRTDDARKQYEDAVAKFSRAPRAAMRLAALYAREGDELNRALELAAAAKEQLPDDPSVSDTLGWVYVRRGLPTLALSHLEDAVRVRPTDPIYRYHLGLAYQGAGNSRRAQEELTRALAIDPTFPDADDARSRLASLPR